MFRERVVIVVVGIVSAVLLYDFFFFVFGEHIFEVEKFILAIFACLCVRESFSGVPPNALRE